MARALWWSLGEGLFSYERGTPVVPLIPLHPQVPLAPRHSQASLVIRGGGERCSCRGGDQRRS